MGMRRRVVVGLSGGVDSAVSALLLQRSGQWDVHGLFMSNWDHRDELATSACSSADDEAAARDVAAHLGIPLHRVSFEREYWHRVFEPMVAGYAAGRTPNPDMWCNARVKFDLMSEHARRALGAQAVATGHYCRRDPATGLLTTGADPQKDQTFFLGACDPRRQLADVLFPLGDVGGGKATVRRLAAEAGLPNACRRESMGICFVGKKRSFADFLRGYLPEEAVAPGPVRLVGGLQSGFHSDWDSDTERVRATLRGLRHRGLPFYTVGQRAKLAGLPCPLHVVGFAAAENALLVADRWSNPELLQSTWLSVSGLRWWRAPADPDSEPVRCSVRIRHGGPLQPCVVHGDVVTLAPGSHPALAVAPGQPCVFYGEGEGEGEGEGAVPVIGCAVMEWSQSLQRVQEEEEEGRRRQLQQRGIQRRGR